MIAVENVTPVPQVVRWRFGTGVGLFVLGASCPLAIPLVAFTSLGLGWKVSLSGLLVLGIPELLWLAAAAVMGKSGLTWIKRRALRMIRAQVAQEVSLRRYRVGLFLFVLPLLFVLLVPYCGGYIPVLDSHLIWFHVGGDLLFLTSLLVLGGDFWDKLGALFVHEAKAVFPNAAEPHQNQCNHENTKESNDER